MISLGGRRGEKIFTCLTELLVGQGISFFFKRPLCALFYYIYIISRTLNDICNSETFPKLCTYNQFKIDFILKNYLLILENRGHQIALSKFRISSHNLRIESGRCETNPKLEPNERLCFFCSKDAVENENNFLLECSLYEDERNALLDAKYKLKILLIWSQKINLLKL